MISERNYKRMATEVLEILKLYPEDTQEKVPAKLIAELEKNRLPDMKVKLDTSKKLHEQELCDETLVMVYMIYRNYIAKPDEKAHFDEILEKFDEETRKQYDPANIFKDTKPEEAQSNTSLEDR